jgi:hypothetical protein
MTVGELRGQVHGTPVDLSALSTEDTDPEGTDTESSTDPGAAAAAAARRARTAEKVARLRKLFKVTDAELACRSGACVGALEACVVSKVAARDVGLKARRG